MNDEQVMRPNPTIKKIYLYRDPIDFRNHIVGWLHWLSST